MQPLEDMENQNDVQDMRIMDKLWAKDTGDEVEEEVEEEGAFTNVLTKSQKIKQKRKSSQGKHPDCIRVIEESWRARVYRCPMFILASKLKWLKTVLKVWNVNVFGNVRQRVKNALNDVQTIQNCINELGQDNDYLDQKVLAQRNLLNALNMEEEFWKEKAIVNGHINGDRNTSFFHRVTQIRQISKSVNLLKVREEVITNQEKISHHALIYFTELFGSLNITTNNSLISEVIPCLVTEAENNYLTCVPSTEEIKGVGFSMNGDGAPGPNGFGGCFYQTYWDIVGKDVCNSVNQFFNSG
ncbi:PREDICTED: uncharacterized protein LOC109357999 [Lupinus angustifolius]|uniref:uncharacterized protein LOC109357999 n=1 Tax=Lupinus angustifolius TaxID=3871 RepID=UPI00092FD33B|nr:PREDICTED: uncharacterized protein LOC109357999 [Lupinus angustifolius]